jgi:RNA polymerase sigma-70 factor (ECF subfamily)
MMTTARATIGRGARSGDSRAALCWRWLGRLLALTREERDASGAAATGDAATEHDHASESERDRFETFFHEHQGRVFGYLLRMTGDEQAAHDLSQETFVRAWRHFARITAYEAPAGWLLRVATNLALSARRHRRHPAGEPVRLPLDEDAPARSDPALRFAEVDAVQRVLLALAPRQRAALVLREVYGLSCEEVGTALGVSRDAAKMLLLRGRERFRARYEADERGEGGRR